MSCQCWCYSCGVVSYLICSIYIAGAGSVAVVKRVSRSLLRLSIQRVPRGM